MNNTRGNLPEIGPCIHEFEKGLEELFEQLIPSIAPFIELDGVFTHAHERTYVSNKNSKVEVSVITTIEKKVDFSPN